MESKRRPSQFKTFNPDLFTILVAFSKITWQRRQTGETIYFAQIESERFSKLERNTECEKAGIFGKLSNNKNRRCIYTVKPALSET